MPQRPFGARRFIRSGLRRSGLLRCSLLGLAALIASPPPRAEPRPLAVLLPACQACHGPQGVSGDAEIPNLAGQPRAYLAKQLAAFRSGERKNELMAAIAAQLDETEAAALAAYWSALPAAPAAPAASAASAAAPVRSRMVFPAGFPSGFVRYESVPGSEGRSVRRYANTVAWNAARAGEPLPEGAVVIVANHDMPAGPAVSYAAMERVGGRGATIPALLRNGDWDYALFGADRVRRDINIAACLACHQPLAASSHVFTAPALRAAARAASAPP